MQLFKRDQAVTFRLQQRDIEIVRIVNRYRYVQARHLKRLVFKDNSSIQSTRRRLNKLFHAGYLGRIEQATKRSEGQAEIVYHLEKAGAELINQYLPEEPIYWYPRSAKKAQHLFLEHALALAEFRSFLELALYDHPISSIKRFVADFEMKSHTDDVTGSYRYKLYAQVIDPVQRNVYVVYPDALVILQGRGKYSEHQRLFFVEIDRGSESHEIIRKKIIGYALYRQQGLFQKYGPFKDFRVLMQTSSESRAHNMRQRLAHLEGEELVWITHKNLVNEQTLVSEPIWLTYDGTMKSILKQG